MTRTLDWPFPVSVNAMYATRINKRTGKPVVYTSAAYKRWQEQAHWSYIEQRRLFGGPVLGHFKIKVILDAKRRKTHDCDNFLKVCLDQLQRLGVIENDRLQDKAEITWGDAPSGCRVLITEAGREAA